MRTSRRVALLGAIVVVLAGLVVWRLVSAGGAPVDDEVQRKADAIRSQYRQPDEAEAPVDDSAGSVRGAQRAPGG